MIEFDNEEALSRFELHAGRKRLEKPPLLKVDKRKKLVVVTLEFEKEAYEFINS